MRLTVGLVAAMLLVTACGGDPIEAAENCSELRRAAASEVEEAAGDQERIERIAEAVEAKAIELGEAAIARGAELEAAICVEAAVETEAAAVEKVFTSVANTLATND